MNTAPDWGALLARFFNDDRLHIVLILIVLDVALGVAASLRRGDFRLSYLSAFLRDDVLGKVVPWFVLYGASLLVTSDIIIPGLDLDLAQNGVWLLTLAALSGSLLSSLADLGVNLRVSAFGRAVATPEYSTAEVVVVPVIEPRAEGNSLVGNAP